MTGRAVALLASAVLGLALLCVAGLFTLSGAASACSAISTPSVAAGRYNSEQLHAAQVIVTVGVQNRVPLRGQVIAVATALQESGLRNLGNRRERNDHDSLGLFQQRPSQDWGTPAQLMDPAYAAGAFYRRLVTIAGWQTMPLTVAAQQVQRSAYPDAYAKWEADATALVRLVSAEPGDDSAPSQQCISVGGWMMPVQGTVVSGFRTDSRPSHDGLDIAAAKGTPIHAAGAGLVIRVVCDAYLVNAGPYSCDVDGDPQRVRGCGWYVELLHPDSTVTRYCHLVRRPSVAVGQHVAVGQVIGQVGSSGHSSGPHLHVEIHVRREALNNRTEVYEPVDPVAFLAQRGVKLGAA